MPPSRPPRGRASSLLRSRNVLGGFWEGEGMGVAFIPLLTGAALAESRAWSPVPSEKQSLQKVVPDQSGPQHPAPSPVGHAGLGTEPRAQRGVPGVRGVRQPSGGEVWWWRCEAVVTQCETALAAHACGRTGYREERAGQRRGRASRGGNRKRFWYFQQVAVVTVQNLALRARQ